MTRISECVDKMQSALERAGRRMDVGDITLVVASKSQPAEKILEVVEELSSLNVPFVLGENYVQEWEAKRAPHLLSYPCHLIGHLQSNKAKKACELFQCIETIDSLSLSAKVPSVVQFLQCNISLDQGKYGVTPEELPSLWQAVKRAHPQTPLRGIMAITREYDDGVDARKDFAAMKKLRDLLENEAGHAVSLSMGMSNDFEIALEEGATHIRLGTALFGPRH
jgi:pyridoxal phosphate enzyme (YggS family)